MIRIAYFTIVTHLLVAQVISQSSRFETHTFDNGTGYTLPYRFYVAKNVQAGKKYPLLLFLHGAGDWGTDNSRQLSNFPYFFIDSSHCETYPCYILAPQCTESSPWSSFPTYPHVQTPSYPTKSISQVLSLIDTLLERDSLKIDKNRIYVTGFSLGGEGAFDIITRAPDLFAAAIPICGIADTGKAQLMKNTPLWIFHGSDDDINDVTYSRIIVDALIKIGRTPKYTEYKGYNHSVWSKAYNEPELLPWLFSHDKSRPVFTINQNAYKIEGGNSVSVKRNEKVITLSGRTVISSDIVEVFTLDGKCINRKKIDLENSSTITNSCRYTGVQIYSK